MRDEVRIERVEEVPTPETTGRRSDRRSSPEIDVSDVRFDVPSATATKLQRRLAEAAVAFGADRFPEAERLLNSIDRLAPDVVEVLELRGLTHYRLGRWGRAMADLDRFVELTGSVEQHPVLADCARALRQWNRADELWSELRDVSPAASLVEEGRIVQAGTLADRGRLGEAIELLERAPRVGRSPQIHHLRRWYALADLSERAGDLAKARGLFRQIVDADRSFGDAAERLASLG